ncbi:hypothetical protein [Desulfosporosinus sp. BICA1-9]|uniref:hypothetical protein n=1 Tax=Desulfosporosinus sp. BICA1-9 TaxID=1531958 RepID=UPI00054BBFB7|nr:hypothetical protein [Desulfosporosinus sp. BICA1-9]KJS46461.1 MAG: hypothetical protein VR66_25305 [Peptococcaceae bacterium BRH_c23]KJS79186.1 MAG: hypothetical protein JL57_30210 [Desulfosporosinus sp. BICA1-9]HBW37871.1 hypothetical protein [Desulfosporosinus sp.]
MVEDGKAAFEDTVSEDKERAQQAFEAIKSSGIGNYQGTSNADYLVSSGKQLILGNYTNDVTGLGTAAN